MQVYKEVVIVCDWLENKLVNLILCADLLTSCSSSAINFPHVWLERMQLIVVNMGWAYWHWNLIMTLSRSWRTSLKSGKACFSLKPLLYMAAFAKMSVRNIWREAIAVNKVTQTVWLQYWFRFMHLHWSLCFSALVKKKKNEIKNQCLKAASIQLKVQSCVRSSGPGLSLPTTICFSSCFLDSPCWVGAKVACVDMCVYCLSGETETFWVLRKIVVKRVLQRNSMSVRLCTISVSPFFLLCFSVFARQKPS